MYKYMPHCYDMAPRGCGMLLFELQSKLVGGFSDYLNVLYYRKEKHRVGGEIRFCSALHILVDIIDRVNNMAKS